MCVCVRACARASVYQISTLQLHPLLSPPSYFPPILSNHPPLQPYTSSNHHLVLLSPSLPFPSPLPFLLPIHGSTYLTSRLSITSTTPFSLLGVSQQEHRPAHRYVCGHRLFCVCVRVCACLCVCVCLVFSTHCLTTTLQTACPPPPPPSPPPQPPPGSICRSSTASKPRYPR